MFSSLISLSSHINGFKGAIFEYSRLVSPFLVAVANINKDPNVLPGIQLNAVINITKPMNAFDNLKAGKTCHYRLLLDKLHLHARKTVTLVSRKL